MLAMLAARMGRPGLGDSYPVYVGNHPHLRKHVQALR
jgi:hypothetical protein